MRSNKCLSCDGRKSNKYWKYCTSCAKEIKKIIPDDAQMYFNNYSNGEYAYILMLPKHGILTITCDKREDVATTLRDLCGGIRVEFGVARIINGYEFTIHNGDHQNVPYIIFDEVCELILDRHDNVVIQQVQRYEQKFEIRIRKLTPQELARQQ